MIIMPLGNEFRIGVVQQEVDKNHYLTEHPIEEGIDVIPPRLRLALPG